MPMRGLSIQHSFLLLKEQLRAANLEFDPTARLIYDHSHLLARGGRRRTEPLKLLMRLNLRLLLMNVKRKSFWSYGSAADGSQERLFWRGRIHMTR